MWQKKYALAVPKNMGVGVNFGRAVKAISSLGVRSPWYFELHIAKITFFLPFLLKLFWGSSTTKPKLRGSCNIFLRVNFLSNHWLCSAILLATTN